MLSCTSVLSYSCQSLLLSAIHGVHPLTLIHKLSLSLSNNHPGYKGKCASLRASSDVCVCSWGHVEGMYRSLFGSAWHGCFKPILRVSGAHSFLVLLALHKAKEMTPRPPHADWCLPQLVARTQIWRMKLKRLLCIYDIDTLLYLWRHRSKYGNKSLKRV